MDNSHATNRGRFAAALTLFCSLYIQGADLAVQDVLSMLPGIPTPPYEEPNQQARYIAENFDRDSLPALLTVAADPKYKDDCVRAWVVIGDIVSTDKEAVQLRLLKDVLEKCLTTRDYSFHVGAAHAGYVAIAKHGGPEAFNYLVERATPSFWKEHKDFDGATGTVTREFVNLRMAGVAITALSFLTEPEYMKRLQDLLGEPALRDSIGQLTLDDPSQVARKQVERVKFRQELLSRRKPR